MTTAKGYGILGFISGTTKFDGFELSNRFIKEVLNNKDWSWYVDYWIESAAEFNVDYFGQNPRLHWTNERINQRPSKAEVLGGAEGGHWSSDDVGEWFISNGVSLPEGTYAHTFEFEAGHTSQPSVHTVRIEAGKVTINGVENSRAWERYVEQGIRGALSDFRIHRLVSLIIEEVF